jgi:hypothetical protein
MSSRNSANMQINLQKKKQEFEKKAAQFAGNETSRFKEDDENSLFESKQD